MSAQPTSDRMISPQADLSCTTLPGDRPPDHRGRVDVPSLLPPSSQKCQKCLRCPLNRAPWCFKTILTRALELGESNFIPTNWRGFSDHFNLQRLAARGAEELVEAWANRHPYKHENTLHKIVEYAKSTDHRKLLHDFQIALRGEFCVERQST